MRKKRNKADWILIAGLTGILGALFTFLSDMILIGRPVSAHSFLKLGTESMADLAYWRITSGTILGIIVLPFQIIGLSTVYHGLKPAAKAMRYVVVFLFAHALIMGVAFHTSYAFIGSGWKLYYHMGSADLFASDIVKRFDFLWKVIVGIILVELLLSSIFYAIIILKRKTIYPKWMSIFNPICVLLFLYPFILVLPAPIGGYIAPGYFNLATMLFFILSTASILKKFKADFV